MTFEELMQGLSWPLLLRAFSLAVQPSRLLLGIVAVLLLRAVVWAYDAAFGAAGGRAFAGEFIDEVRWAPQAAAASLLRFEPEQTVVDLYQNTFGAAVRLVSERPFTGSLLLLLLLPIWAIAGGAICRLVAVDVAGHLNMTVRQGLRFALPKTASLVGVLLVPLVVAAVIALGLKLAGWVLLSLSVVNLAGSVLYGLNLAAGLVLALVFAGYILGHATLVPAVSADGADAVDAVQRAYAYVLGRPGRTVLYVAGAIVQGLIVLAVVRWIIGMGVGAAEGLSSSWISELKARRLFDPTSAERPAAAAMIDLWRSGAGLLLSGFAVSLYFTSSTLVYLLLRRVCDEQDIHEVWMPGLVEGSPAAAAAEVSAAGSTEIDPNDTRSGDLP